MSVQKEWSKNFTSVACRQTHHIISRNALFEMRTGGEIINNSDGKHGQENMTESVSGFWAAKKVLGKERGASLPHFVIEETRT